MAWFLNQKSLGTGQGSSLIKKKKNKHKTNPLLETLADGERACFGLVAHKQEKLI